MLTRPKAMLTVVNKVWWQRPGQQSGVLAIVGEVCGNSGRSVLISSKRALSCPSWVQQSSAGVDKGGSSLPKRIPALPSSFLIAGPLVQSLAEWGYFLETSFSSLT